MGLCTWGKKGKKITRNGSCFLQPSQKVGREMCVHQGSPEKEEREGKRETETRDYKELTQVTVVYGG